MISSTVIVNAVKEYDSYMELFFKIFFIQKYIKIIYFLIFKKLFFILIHSNDLKISKIY